LFIASKDLPMLSRPILLVYVFEILANVLSLLTFKTQKRETEIATATMDSLISKAHHILLLSWVHDLVVKDISAFI
jgi:hypothetical protein